MGIHYRLIPSMGPAEWEIFDVEAEEEYSNKLRCPRREHVVTMSANRVTEVTLRMVHIQHFCACLLTVEITLRLRVCP